MADASELIGWMLAGLKNWEQGMPAEAAPFFRAIAEAELPEQTHWAAIYQQSARDYLHDLDLLSRPVFSTIPNAVSEADAAITELDGILAGLRTQGRARFNVRAWQYDLARHRKRLADASAAPPEAPPLERFARLAAECRFAEAADLMRAPVGDALPHPSRHALRRIAQDAAEFLTDLGIFLAATTSPWPALTLKSGETAENLRPRDTDGLVDGVGRPVRWSEIDADALIEIHRERIRQTSADAERLRRNECAIAFDWLAGDRERARVAAARLAEQHPDFRERWESMLPHLPE